MTERTIEDLLREEYFDLLPEIRRVAEHLEAEVKYFVLPISRRLNKYEQIVVTSRIKGCESSLEALRRRQQGATFDRNYPENYSLTSLNDLAGVRVLAFPRNRLVEIDKELRNRFTGWVADPVLGYDDINEPQALKYHGYCEASSRVRGELQIVSMLLGLFWEVEHSAIYKPTLQLEFIARNREMKQRTREVFRAFRAFEEEFEKQISDSLKQSQ